MGDKDKDLKGILKKDGEPRRDMGPITIDAPLEDPNKTRSSRILTREDTKHHVLEGVEWPEGEDAPKAVLSAPKPRNSIAKKKPAAASPDAVQAKPAPPTTSTSSAPPPKKDGCTLC